MAVVFGWGSYTYGGDPSRTKGMGPRGFGRRGECEVPL